MNATSSTVEKLKAAQKATWMAGDFGMVAKYLEPGAMEIWNRLALPSGIRLLDVACVNGQLVIDQIHLFECSTKCRNCRIRHRR